MIVAILNTTSHRGTVALQLEHHVVLFLYLFLITIAGCVIVGLTATAKEYCCHE